MSDTTDYLYEELILLDEIAGELDPESNARTEARRQAILAEIREIEKLSSRWG